MTRILKPTKRFRKDLKKLIASGQKDIDKLETIMAKLAEGVPLDARHKDHPLGGNFAGYRDCHIEPDWLLIYKVTTTHITLVRTGSHSEVLEK